jgi:hypothetical protein
MARLPGSRTADDRHRGRVRAAAGPSCQRGADHAEGIAVLARSNGRTELLVVYDSPARQRLHDDGSSIDADVFRL